MNLTHEGLSLWYGTPDAPAPGDAGPAPRQGASLVVGAHPAHPTNTVSVRYRVDGGLARTAPGRELRTDFARQVQYFVVDFPPFPTGEVVEYSPVLGCGGRQVPPDHIASRFPSQFRLAPPRQEGKEGQDSRGARSASGPATKPREQRFTAGVAFVGTVAVQFDAPQFIGEMAEGMRINFIVRDGTVEGPGFKARVTVASSDHMLVRRDGIGVVHIQAAFVTEDGAILDVDAGGTVDFGADGFRRALAHDLPDRSPLTISPLIATRHPRYKWLSRIQCVGVGETHLDAGQAAYHVYAVSPRGLHGPL